MGGAWYANEVGGPEAGGSHLFPVRRMQLRQFPSGADANAGRFGRNGSHVLFRSVAQLGQIAASSSQRRRR